jgi:hypothetical protein
MGMVKRDLQNIETVLAYFGKKRRRAIARYVSIVGKGISHSRHPELVGGGR